MLNLLKNKIRTLLPWTVLLLTLVLWMEAEPVGLWWARLSQNPDDHGRVPSAADASRYNSQLREAARSMRQPLRFWGRVADQDGGPMEGVKVFYRAQLVDLPWIGAMGTHEEYGSTLSGADGAFFFDAGRGMRVELTYLIKSGYQLAQDTNRFFEYPSTKPGASQDPAKPARFVLVHESAVEPQHSFNVSFHVPCDGTPCTVDLKRGKATPEGQLRVVLTRNPLRVEGIETFDWWMRLEMTGGGLVEVEPPLAVKAPEEGYKEQISYEFTGAKSPFDPRWCYSTSRYFYCRTAAGEYGRMRIIADLSSREPPVRLEVESWLNPSGSRNLQFEKSKALPPAP